MSRGNPDFTKSVKLHGVDENGNLVTVLLDSQGNIQAVLKGSYGGTLIPVALDSQGAIIARLREIPQFSPKGRVVWYDGFECGIGKWEFDSAPEGGSFTLSTTVVRTGGYAGYIQTAGTSPNTAWINHRFVYPGDTGFGVEFSFTNLAQNSRFSIYLYIHNGDQEYQMELQYRFDDEYLYILNENADYVQIAGPLTFRRNVEYFHTMKLAVNPANGAYIYALLDDTEVDLTGQNGWNVSSTTYRYIDVTLLLHNTLNVIADSYFDDVIITLDES